MSSAKKNFEEYPIYIALLSLVAIVVTLADRVEDKSGNVIMGKLGLVFIAISLWVTVGILIGMWIESNKNQQRGDKKE